MPSPRNPRIRLLHRRLLGVSVRGIVSINRGQIQKWLSTVWLWEQGKIIVSWYVLQELLDQVNMGHDHSPAAVSLASQLVHRISINLVRVSDKGLRSMLTHLGCLHQ